jgi:hypothetical protein
LLIDPLYQMFHRGKGKTYDNARHQIYGLPDTTIDNPAGIG